MRLRLYTDTSKSRVRPGPNSAFVEGQDDAKAQARWSRSGRDDAPRYDVRGRSLIPKKQLSSQCFALKTATEVHV